MKKLTLTVLATMICMWVAGCGNEVLGIEKTMDRAFIKTPQGEVIEVHVDNHAHATNGMVTIYSEGVAYMIHGENLMMVGR